MDNYNYVLLWKNTKFAKLKSLPLLGSLHVSAHVQATAMESFSFPVQIVLKCPWRVALRFADHVTKRNGGCGDENGMSIFFCFLTTQHAPFPPFSSVRTSATGNKAYM